jgi:hypothetical protein
MIEFPIDCVVVGYGGKKKGNAFWGQERGG